MRADRLGIDLLARLIGGDGARAAGATGGSAGDRPRTSRSPAAAIHIRTGSSSGDHHRRGDRRAAASSSRDRDCRCRATRVASRAVPACARSGSGRSVSSSSPRYRAGSRYGIGKPLGWPISAGSASGRRRWRWRPVAPADREHDAASGHDARGDRLAVQRWGHGRSGGIVLPHSIRPIGVDDREAGAARRLLREDAVRARATRRVASVGAERVERDAQRGHVADHLDRDLARAFRRRRRARARAHRRSASRAVFSVAKKAISASGSSAALRIRKTFAPVGIRASNRGSAGRADCTVWMNRRLRSDREAP